MRVQGSDKKLRRYLNSYHPCHSQKRNAIWAVGILKYSLDNDVKNKNEALRNADTVP